MKRAWILAAAAATFSLGALTVAAQGPQGVGAAEAAQSASGPHTLNPIKWVKKDPHTETASFDANSSQDAKLSSILQTQDLLPADASLKETCSDIKDLSDCVAALHAVHNLGLDFGCVKSKLSGVQTNLTTASACASTTDGRPVSLRQAIHSLKPNADSKSEAKKAEAQSRQDLTAANLGS
jgi:hypothetical protein